MTCSSPGEADGLGSRGGRSGHHPRVHHKKREKWRCEAVNCAFWVEPPGREAPSERGEVESLRCIGFDATMRWVPADVIARPID